MQRTKKPKSRSGPLLVMGILILAVLAALGTCTRYTSDNPSTTQARLETPHTVVAFFHPEAAKKIRPGMQAITTVSVLTSQKFTGRVSSVKNENNFTVVSLALDKPAETATPASSCQVTVDTSVPPEILK